ncbi:hypothetical protein ACHAWF_018749 [Thalassiosira exigua]
MGSRSRAEAAATAPFVVDADARVHSRPPPPSSNAPVVVVVDITGKPYRRRGIMRRVVAMTIAVAAAALLFLARRVAFEVAAPSPQRRDLARLPSPSTPANNTYTHEHAPDSTIRSDGEIGRRRRRLTHMEYAHKLAPADLKRLHEQMRQQGRQKQKKFGFADPQSTSPRKAMPLDASPYELNPLVKPEGYPWHRWSANPDGSYPLEASKFVRILSLLGTGEDTVGTISPRNYTLDGVKLTPEIIRLGPHVRPYIIKGGTVLRPDGRTGMFVTLVQRAVEMAGRYAHKSPRMKLLTEGELPLIFDANDYPWCGDDLVPIFRLNLIKPVDGPKGCRHAWPAMSLTYFSDPTNVQLAESPYEWDKHMERWDDLYPWEQKIPKAVWRGRITGYTYPDGQRPRQNLVRHARNFLDVMDVKPSTKRSKMDQDDFQKFKAIIDIDGNAWSARLGKLLCYNSVVIKKEIEPWVHYIPVQSDFADLEKTVRYVIDPKNADEMRRIIHNGQQFCRTKLTMEQYTVDILWTLLSYAELLTGSPDFYDKWRNDGSAYRLPGMDMSPWRSRIASGAG